MIEREPGPNKQEPPDLEVDVEFWEELQAVQVNGCSEMIIHHQDEEGWWVQGRTVPVKE